MRRKGSTNEREHRARGRAIDVGYAIEKCEVVNAYCSISLCPSACGSAQACAGAVMDRGALGRQRLAQTIARRSAFGGRS